MAPPAGAYVVKSISLTFDTVEFANQTTRARLVPDQPSSTLRTLVPDGVVQDVDTPAWTLQLSAVQDYVAARGLARLLTDNAGSEAEITLMPSSPGGVEATVTVKLKAVDFGGEQGQWAMFETELPVVGQPVFADPV
jgi:hypothetical protein